MTYRTTTRRITHNKRTLRALPIGAVIGTEAGVFARYMGDECWHVAWPDNAYMSGYRMEKYVHDSLLPCVPLYEAEIDGQ